MLQTLPERLSDKLFNSMAVFDNMSDRSSYLYPPLAQRDNWQTLASIILQYNSFS